MIRQWVSKLWRKTPDPFDAAYKRALSRKRRGEIVHYNHQDTLRACLGKRVIDIQVYHGEVAIDFADKSRLTITPDKHAFNSAKWRLDET